MYQYIKALQTGMHVYSLMYKSHSLGRVKLQPGYGKPKGLKV